MQFSVLRWLEARPLAYAVTRAWMRRGLPVPTAMRLRTANEFHAELIARLMGVVSRKGRMDQADAMAAARELGAEMAPGVAQLLALKADDTADSGRLEDFVHGLLHVGGAQAPEGNAVRSLSRWRACPVAGELAATPGGKAYCHLYQSAFRGALAALKPKERAEEPVEARALGCDYCELAELGRA